MCQPENPASGSIRVAIRNKRSTFQLSDRHLSPLSSSPIDRVPNMPFSNQFALSLEVTRLVPMRLVVSKAYETVMSLARDLQNSGSNIVIEEDLADVFGRSRISTQFERSFATVIKKDGTTLHCLCEGRILAGGPGSPVGRALNNTPYLSTVIQLSLLTWVAPYHFLAPGISNALQKRLTGASQEHVKAVPDQEGISGVLVAVHEQTSSFDWSKYLVAVANVLPDININAALRPPPTLLLQGLMDMFPMVQSLPAERMMYIRCCSGFSSLVVWAHILLDLTVLVRSANGKEKRFGTGTEQVLIELLDPKLKLQSSVSLLDSSDEVLFRIVPDPWEDLYPSMYLKWPAKGFAKLTFGEICSRRFPLATDEIRQAVVEELLRLTGSVAAIICDNLVVDRYSTGIHSKDDIPWIVPRYRLLEAARLLFEEPELREKDMLEYQKDYLLKPLDEDMVPPVTLDTLMKDMLVDRKRKIWRQFRHGINRLSLHLIAFAHVHDLRHCGGIPLEDQQTNLVSHALLKQISDWDGRTKLSVDEGCWLNIFSHLLTGQGSRFYDLTDLAARPVLHALVSGRGWSAYVGTIGVDDPYSIAAGRITITKGVPQRSGVSRRGIMDGPAGATTDFTENWKPVEKAGEWAHLRCMDDVEFGRPRCGEYQHLFLVTLPVQQCCHDKPDLEQSDITHFGFRHMHRAVWRSTKSEPCDHSVDVNQKLRSPPGCKTMSNICSGNYDESYPKVTICLTAHHTAGRWRALCQVALLCGDKDEEEAYGAHILLRGDDCCFSCAIDQVAARPGRSFIIL